MGIKDIVLKEIQSKDLADGLMDIALKSTKNLSSSQRRNILFELELEGKIVIKNIPQIQDETFPLLIIECIK